MKEWSEVSKVDYVGNGLSPGLSPGPVAEQSKATGDGPKALYVLNRTGRCNI